MKGIKTVSHILFEFSFGMQIMIVVVYWTVIHTQAMERLTAIGAHYQILSHFVIHILPAANIFFNVTFSHIKFRYSHVIYTILITLSFFVFNYYGVIYFNKGKPIYSFFPWVTDFRKSVINAAGLLAMACVVYLCSCVYVNKGLRQGKNVTPKKGN